MFPVVVFLGRKFSMYALMSVIGLLCGGFIFCRRIKKAGQDDNEAIIFLMVLSIGMLIGGHLLYAITNLDMLYMLLDASSLSEIFLVLRELFGGMVFYGGLFGAYILGNLYVKLRKLDKMLYLDNAALFAPIFHGFARIGCFFGGCCYGIESSLGFSARGNTITDIGEVSRFPVQLLESALNFLIALVVFILLKNKILKGRIFYAYLALYALVRFFDEFLRGDRIRGFIFGLSTSQFISIFVEFFAMSVILLHILKENRKKHRKSE